DGSDQRVRHRRETPEKNRNGIADLCAVTVDEPAEAEQADGIGTLKCGVDQSELLVAPAELAIEKFFDQRENLTIDVVDRSREKQQCAYDPAHSAHAIATGSNDRQTRPAGNS